MMVTDSRGMARRYLPFFFASALFLAGLAVTVGRALRYTHGVFAYALDDAYVHLAIARHIAFDGVYGITKYAFTAASSSIGWPLLLAGIMRVGGDQIAIPLFINGVAALALIAVIAHGFKRDAPDLDTMTRSIATAAIALLIPLTTLTMIGMEHVLHAALSVAFVLEAPHVLVRGRRPLWPLLLLASMLVITRYEGAFLVGITALMFAARRRVAFAMALVLAGGGPIAAFGWFSIARGGLFLPNSLLLKSRGYSLLHARDVFNQFGVHLYRALVENTYLVSLTATMTILLVYEVRRNGLRSAGAARLCIALSATLAHVELANLGWFFRYEAYLIAVDVTVIVIAVAPTLRSVVRSPIAWTQRWWFQTAPTAMLLAIAITPLIIRSVRAQVSTALACCNIFEQQVQSARFLSRYFSNESIIVNDIGAVAYYGDKPIIDLFGLGSNEIAKLKWLRSEPMTAERITEFSHEAPIAMLYDEWFSDVPDAWRLVGKLRIDGNRVCWSDTVTVYATSVTGRARVHDALLAFEASLPGGAHLEFVQDSSEP